MPENARISISKFEVTLTLAKPAQLVAEMNKTHMHTKFRSDGPIISRKKVKHKSSIDAIMY